MKNIVAVVLELRQNEKLPAICFNDDSEACFRLAIKLFDYFEKEQQKFEESDEFKSKYVVKNEEVCFFIISAFVAKSKLLFENYAACCCCCFIHRLF